LEFSIPSVWSGERLNLSCQRPQQSQIRSRLRFAVEAVQFFEVAGAGLAVARILAFPAQGGVKLRQARISGR
jgi:hypothetical protein